MTTILYLCCARATATSFAGTSPGAYVIRISKEGKAFTILDSSMEEIRSLAVDRSGTIYAAASSSAGQTTKSTGKTDLSLRMRRQELCRFPRYRRCQLPPTKPKTPPALLRRPRAEKRIPAAPDHPYTRSPRMEASRPCMPRRSRWCLTWLCALMDRFWHRPVPRGGCSQSIHGSRSLSLPILPRSK